MHVAKTVLRLDFEEALNPFRELRGMLRIASADQGLELQLPPIVIAREKEGRRIQLQVRAITVEQQSQSISAPVDPEDAWLTAQLRNLAAESPFPKLRAVTYSSAIIEPWPLAFNDLMARLRDLYFRSNSMALAATDLSIVYDEHIDGGVRHVQLGPMDKKQLRANYLLSDVPDIPEVFEFVELSVRSDNFGPFDVGEVAAFVVEAREWQMLMAEQFVRELQEG